MAAHQYSPCLYKGNCELNCQVFVSEDDTNVATSSLCFACKHLAAFHEQVVSVPVASSTRPAFANAKESTCAGNETRRFGKTKTFVEWKAEKNSSAFRKKSKLSNKPQEPQSVTMNIGLMLFDERVMGLKAKWG